jgi:hypothetical protein
VYGRVCHALLRFSKQIVPAYSAKVSRTNIPSCTMWFRQFTKHVTKTDHKVWCHPHSTEHDTQPIVFLISKQVVPYRTHSGTCCHGVSTPKIWSLAYSSMIDHITWRNSTVFTIPTLLKQQHRSSPHICKVWIKPEKVLFPWIFLKPPRTKSGLTGQCPAGSNNVRSARTMFDWACLLSSSFYAKTKYSSYTWPKINCLTHTAKSVHR